MNTLDLIRANKGRLAAKEAKYIRKQLAPKNEPKKGIYLGYNNGVHEVKLVDGSVIKGDLISNGAIAKGATVQVNIPKSGIPLIKSVAR